MPRILWPLFSGHGVIDGVTLWLHIYGDAEPEVTLTSRR